MGATAAGRLVTDAGQTRQLLSTNVVPESFTKTGEQHAVLHYNMHHCHDVSDIASGWQHVILLMPLRPAVRLSIICNSNKRLLVIALCRHLLMLRGLRLWRSAEPVAAVL